MPLSRTQLSKNSRSKLKRLKESKIKRKKLSTIKSNSKSSNSSSPFRNAATKLQKIVRGRQTRRSVLGSPKTCGICLEDVNNLNKSNLKCINKHPYHEKCLNEWLIYDQKLSCPTCRSNIPLTNGDKIAFLLKQYNMNQLNMLEKKFSYFIESVERVWGYDEKKMPAIESHLVPDFKGVLKVINYLKKLKRFSKSELNKLVEEDANYIRLDSTINLMYNEILNSINDMEAYKKSRINRYREAELGLVDNNPVIHDITGAPDFIARPPRTERGIAMTRRIRSH